MNISNFQFPISNCSSRGNEAPNELVGSPGVSALCGTQKTPERYYAVGKWSRTAGAIGNQAPSRLNVLTFKRSNGFTLIEIALSLAVIAFALVAIIGVLPTGMQVQRDNREETIINQDAAVWLDGLRNGQQGLDNLTNYVDAIEIDTSEYRQIPYLAAKPPTLITSWKSIYSYSNSSVTGNPPFTTPPKYYLTNGLRIVGLLSTPKYIMLTNNEQGSPAQGREYDFFSNHVVAVVRSMSGAASDKPPQTSGDVLDLSFRYRMVVEVNTNTAYLTYNPTNGTTFPNHVTQDMQANLYDMRLLFRWPLLVNGDTGNGRVVFRSVVGGNLSGPTHEFGYKPPTGIPAWSDSLFFLQPRTYAAQ